MPTLPNPNVYLNYLPPDVAFRFEIVRNVVLAVLGAVIWDILIYIPDDIKIIRRSPFYAATFCFVFSRLFSLAFVLVAVLQHTRPNDCKALGLSTSALCMCAVASSTFLFLQRVRAVYSDYPKIKLLFGFLWLGVVAVMTVVFLGPKTGPIPVIGYCAKKGMHGYMSAAVFYRVGFDTLVFLATSYKLATTHSTSDDGISWNTIVTGRALPRLSRTVLQGGQQYFLLIIILNLPVGVIMATSSIPAQYKLMAGHPAVAFSASMACRIYRNFRTQNLAEESRAKELVSTADFLSDSQKTTVDPTQTSSRILSQLPRLTSAQNNLTSESSNDARIGNMV